MARVVPEWCRSDRLRAAVAERVGIDSRSLATFRIGLGAVLLLDVLLRSRDLGAFYTDAGVLPRGTPHPKFELWQGLSLHALSGDLWLQVVLFGLAGLSALAVLVGYRTRTATALSLVLLVSVHARNPLVLNAGDVLLRRLLFWSLFLPLGARWAVDAVHRTDGPARERQVVGPATAGLLVQIVVVYLTNLVLKHRGGAWFQGEAVRQVFALDAFTVLLGDLLAEVPALLDLANWLWVAILAGSPLLLVLTGYPRAVFAGLVATMHLGMALTMQLGIFPLVSVIAMVPFVPPVVWDRLPEPTSGLLGRVARWLPEFGPLVQRERLRPLVSGFAAVAVVAVLVVNTVALGVVAAPEGTPGPIEEPSWDMFAPNPPGHDGWYVMPATLESGEQIDAYAQSNLSWDRPPDLADTYPNARWRKYLSRLRGPGGETLAEPLAEYVCRRWNRHHTERVTHVEIVYVRERATLDYDGERTRLDFGSFECN